MQRLREDERRAESAIMRRGARRAMGTRMYMPEIGRFLSVDPLAEAFPTQSPYNFALNNPINFRDPSGLAPEKEKGDRVLGGQYEYALTTGNILAYYACLTAHLSNEEEDKFNRSAISYAFREEAKRGRTAGGSGGGDNGVSKGNLQKSDSKEEADKKKREVVHKVEPEEVETEEGTVTIEAGEIQWLEDNTDNVVPQVTDAVKDGAVDFSLWTAEEYLTGTTVEYFLGGKSYFTTVSNVAKNFGFGLAAGSALIETIQYARGYGSETGQDIGTFEYVSDMTVTAISIFGGGGGMIFGATYFILKPIVIHEFNFYFNEGNRFNTNSRK